MKGLLFSLVAFFALTIFFPTQNLCAQDLATADANVFSHEQALLSQKTNNETNYQPNFEAGQRLAQFKDFGAFVSNHLVYPELARENGIEGRVEVLLTISDQGKVLSAKIVKSLGLGCDEAALAVVREMPDWTPAMNCGIPVKSKNIVAIDFRLR